MCACERASVCVHPKAYDEEVTMLARVALPMRGMRGMRGAAFADMRGAMTMAKGKQRATAEYEPLAAGWEAVIGVECHIQLKTSTKLFSSFR